VSNLARPLAPDLKAAIDVRDYGSTGAAIQPALDALPSAGGVVDATGLQGTQAVATAITLPANSALLLGYATITFSSSQLFLLADDSQVIGAGRGLTTLKAGVDATADGTPICGAVSGGTSRSLIANLTIDGDSANQTNGNTSSHGIGLTAGTLVDIEIDNVFIKNVKGSGIRVTNLTKNLYIHNCKLEHTADGNVGAIAIGHTDTSSISPTGYRIYDNEIDGTVTTDSTCIKITSTPSSGSQTVTDVKIWGNTCRPGDDSGSTLGIELFCSGEGKILGGHISKNSVRCVAANTETFGISLGSKGVENIVVDGNFVSDAGGIALESADNRDCTFSNNIVKDSQHSTIDGQGTACENIQFTGNSFYNCGSSTQGSLHLIGDSGSSYRGGLSSITTGSYCL